MGTVLKKKAKKLGGKKKKSAEVTNGKLLEAVDATRLEAGTVLTMFAEDVGRVTGSRQVTQSMLEAAIRVKAIAKEAEAAYKAFEEMAKSHRHEEGGFTVGRVAITFPVTTRCSPKWKDEATNHAGELAEERGEEFDADKWVKDTQKKYPASTSTGVKLTVSEG